MNSQENKEGMTHLAEGLLEISSQYEKLCPLGPGPLASPSVVQPKIIYSPSEVILYVDDSKRHTFPVRQCGVWVYLTATKTQMPVTLPELLLMVGTH